MKDYIARRTALIEAENLAQAMEIAKVELGAEAEDIDIRQESWK